MNLDFWRAMGRRFSGNGEARQAAELARLAQLKEIARACRMEDAAQSRQEEGAGVAPSPSVQASRRKRLRDAEGQYAVAAQAWDNKQWRLKGQ